MPLTSYLRSSGMLASLMLAIVAAPAHAITSVWTSLVSTNWRTEGAWASYDATNAWPDAVGDMAVFPGIRETNGISVHTEGTITVGEMRMETGTHCWVGDDWDPSTIVLDNSNHAARIRIDRTAQDGHIFYGLGIWGSTRVELVSDVEVITTPEGNLTSYATCAVFRVEDDVVITGQCTLIKDGAGMMWVGGKEDGRYYRPQIFLGSPLIVQDGWLCVYPEATIEPAALIQPDGIFTPMGSDPIDVDVILNGGMYYPAFANWSHYTNLGTVSVVANSFIRPNSNAHIFLEGELNGTSKLLNDMNGAVHIVGTISPGLGPSNCIGQLTLDTRFAPAWTFIGLTNNQATLEVDVDSPSGTDYDKLICQGRTSVELEHMNLVVRLGNFTLGATCTVVSASMGAVHGSSFNSIQWDPPEFPGKVECDDSSVSVILPEEIPEPVCGALALVLCLYGVTTRSKFAGLTR